MPDKQIVRSEPDNPFVRKIDPGTAFLHMCGCRADGTSLDEPASKSIRHFSQTSPGGAKRKFGQKFAPRH